MRLLRALFPILVLASGAWPLAAMETASRPPLQAGEAELIRLEVRTFNPGGKGLILESPLHPLPARDVEVFWSDEDRDDWVPVSHFRTLKGGLVLLNPAPGGGDLEFVVMVQGKAWGHASHGTPRGEAMDRAEQEATWILSRGPEKEAAAMALLQVFPEEEAGSEDGWEEEELASGSVVPAPAAGDPDQGDADSGEPEDEDGPGRLHDPEASRNYLRNILQTYRLRQCDVSAGTRGPTSMDSGLSEILRGRPDGTYKTMTYARAERIAENLNTYNQRWKLREAPFTGEELFLAGRPLQSLSPRQLFNLILMKDRHFHGYSVAQQTQRLDLNPLFRYVRGDFAISPAVITKLKARLNLPALGLTEADLDRTRCKALTPHLNHPGNVRTREFIHKALVGLGLRNASEFAEKAGMTSSNISEIRHGNTRVSRTSAQRLSEFHNRNFLQDPPTTPAYFMGQ